MKHTQRTRNYARDLFVDGKTIIAIAELTKVNKSTLSRWRKEDDWDRAKEVQNTTPGELRREFMNSINAILQDAKDKGDPLSPGQVDQITKLQSAIQKLDPRSNYISIAMDVFQQFQTHLVKAGIGALTLEDFNDQVTLFMQELFRQMEANRLV